MGLIKIRDNIFVIAKVDKLENIPNFIQEALPFKLNTQKCLTLHKLLKFDIYCEAQKCTLGKNGFKLLYV